MEIRLQLKTHYQVSNPGIFSVLLRECTSLSRSNYPETISKCLAQKFPGSIDSNMQRLKKGRNVHQALENLKYILMETSDILISEDKKYLKKFIDDGDLTKFAEKLPDYFWNDSENYHRLFSNKDFVNLIKKYPLAHMVDLNEESAKFAVVMAQSFGLVTSNMFWDWKGQAINIILEETPRKKTTDYLSLTFAEKILYLKYYLEADGATILKICKRLKSIGQISRKELLSSDFIDRIFIDVWETYRQLTTDLRQKVQLRENIRNLKTKPYTFKTRIHKALAHIEPLVDFDLIERKENRNEILFIPKVNKCFSYLDKLTQELDTIESMESRFSKSEHFEIINSIYNLNAVDYDPEEHSEILYDEIFKIYLKARTEPAKMVSLAMISDVISAKLLTQKRILINRIHIEMELDRLKSDYPRDVHYHVDMSGKKAFLVLSDQLCASTSSAISSLRLTSA